MQQRYREDDKDFDQESLVQTFRGENLFVFSPLLRFYLQLGYEVRNVRIATQYLGERGIAPFIDKAVRMRIEATYEGDETKANTAKVMINSSYGNVRISFNFELLLLYFSFSICKIPQNTP